MSIWADINRRSQGIQVKKEDKHEPEITWYDWQDDINFTYQKLYWDRLAEERKKKEAIEIKKARKEKKFLDIWDCICVISIILLVISLASLCIWTVIKGPDYIPGWLFGTVTISGCIGIIMSGAGQGTFNEMRKHVDEYMK